jgi:biotin carboxyl carrier protein
MPARVVRVLAQTGSRVKRGDILLVLEAMKMQNEIAAPRDGLLREVPVVEGESVTADQIVAVLESR